MKVDFNRRKIPQWSPLNSQLAPSKVDTPETMEKNERRMLLLSAATFGGFPHVARKRGVRVDYAIPCAGSQMGVWFCM